ncbi:uncharacterized protein LOC114434488 [Parambassis ranga]|uniref:Uncharacterized protein LOC114434488 n=1 Tax=Parambassis ranga TaxID=210632 RepID=A0A6P7I4N4_9TELE|nr:uncharacterized protein LOC114434488 [Parambassis ranga]XP_028259580.1 uncharacterized protein LOC114434488 [Parambassis ranga]XP_028259581.1 uncharacterized protein LOC114434488 [Parambassis ranga]
MTPAVTPASLYWIVGLLACSEAAAPNVTATFGDNVKLTCWAPNANITVVLWVKADQESEGFVLLYRDGHFETDGQLTSFNGRVELKEDGDTCLILKDVKTADSGTYKCEVVQEGKRHSQTIHLIVVPAAQNIFSKPGQTVTLPCGSPKNNTTPATWIKDGFESEGYVAQFRDNNFANASQHPSYRGRVKLNRNKSLTMKKLTTADSGTYICETYWGGSFHNETVSLIIVHKGGDSEGRRHVGLAGVFVFVVGFVMYKRHQKKKKHPPVCPDEAAVQQLV